MVKYFVTYQAIDKKGRVNIGNVIANMDYHISKLEDIRTIEKQVKEAKNFQNVIVTNYIKL